MRKLRKNHRILILVGLCLALSIDSFTQSKSVLDYCSIVRSPSSYAGQDVRFKANLSYSTVSRVDGGDAFFFSPQCNNGDYFTLLSFASSSLTSFFKTLKREKNFVFDAEVIGRFESSFPPLYGHLSWSLHKLIVTKLISVKDVSRTQASIKPDYDAETPIKNDGRAISALTTEIIFGFMGTGSIDAERYFSNGVVVIDPEGTQISIAEARELINTELLSINSNSRFVRNPKVKRLANELVATGDFGVPIQNGLEKKSLGYECTFRRSGDGLDLVKIVFTKK